jgi:hypothetical protein
MYQVGDHVAQEKLTAPQVSGSAVLHGAGRGQGNVCRLAAPVGRQSRSGVDHLAHRAGVVLGVKAFQVGVYG